jgi:O-antigen/teichoic acid export membrane protein
MRSPNMNVRRWRARSPKVGWRKPRPRCFISRWALAAAWLATVALVLVVGFVAPHAIIPGRYDLRFVGTGMALWMLVAAIRMARTPESAMLQGAGAFRPLAMASVISAGVSLVAVAVLLLLGGPLWSIVGIGGGELMYAAWIWRQARRWRRNTAAQPLVAVAA